MRSHSDLAPVALAAARAAGDVILSARRVSAAQPAESKGLGDYVTATDRAAEAAAVAVLSVEPEIAILAEEGGGEMAERMWVIDPLDGTTNFVRGYPEVGVSVAYVEAGVPAVGVVLAPLTGGAWTAVRGGGAFDAAGNRLRVDHRPDGVTATGFPFRHPELRPRYAPVLEQALAQFEDLRRPGAACLDLAYAAAGAWAGFFELNLHLWDIAAGVLLVREAGGVASDWNGDEDAVLSSGDILAGGPAWHERMLAITRAAAAA